MANLEEILQELKANTTTTANGSSGVTKAYFNGATLASFSSGASLPINTDWNGNLNTMPYQRYNSVVPTFNTQDPVPNQADVNGNHKVTQATLIAGENLTTNRLNNEPIYSYTRISTATTTLIKTGAGTLHAIIVNTPVTNGVIEADDALTNTTPIIAKATYPATLLSSGPVTVTYDVSFATGLSITTTGTMDITIAWR